MVKRLKDSEIAIQIVVQSKSWNTGYSNCLCITTLIWLICEGIGALNLVKVPNPVCDITHGRSADQAGDRTWIDCNDEHLINRVHNTSVR